MAGHKNPSSSRPAGKYSRQLRTGDNIPQNHRTGLRTCRFEVGSKQEVVNGAAYIDDGR